MWENDERSRWDTATYLRDMVIETEDIDLVFREAPDDDGIKMLLTEELYAARDCEFDDLLHIGHGDPEAHRPEFMKLKEIVRRKVTL